MFITIAFSSCSDNDETNIEDIKKNQIKFEDKIYDISWGEIERENEGDGFYIALFPSTITLNGENQNTYAGSGFILEIEPILTNNDTPEGVYNESKAWVYFIPSGFVNGEYQEDSIEHYIGSNLNFIIKKNANIYEFSITGKDDRGLEFNAYYKGSLIEHE